MSERSLDADSEAVVVYDYTLAVASGRSPVLPELLYVYLVLTPREEDLRRAYIFTPENARVLATRLLAEAEAIERAAEPR